MYFDRNGYQFRSTAHKIHAHYITVDSEIPENNDTIMAGIRVDKLSALSSAPTAMCTLDVNSILEHV